MQMVVVFGLRGAGKTFAGRVFGQYFGYYLYDADADLPLNMRNAIRKQAEVTDAMRDTFFKKIIKKAKRLKIKYKKIVVTQTFLKEKHRKLFIHEFPETKFILVQTARDIREARLMLRTGYPLDLEYAGKMSLDFENPHIVHSLINNNSNGDRIIKKQIRLLLKE